MTPRPRDEMADYRGRGLLTGQRALVTGGDSGIGRAVAIAFAKEGADVAIAYLSEHDDAAHTRDLVEREGKRCVLLPGDLARPEQCRSVVDETLKALHGLEIVVNNIAYQSPAQSLEEITEAQWERTFTTKTTGTAFVVIHAGGQHWPTVWRFGPSPVSHPPERINVEQRWTSTAMGCCWP